MSPTHVTWICHGCAQVFGVQRKWFSAKGWRSVFNKKADAWKQTPAHLCDECLDCHGAWRGARDDPVGRFNNLEG